MRRRGSNSVALRVPVAWAGCLKSTQVRTWLAGFLNRPYTLPTDPGASDTRVFLSLPSRAVEALARGVGGSQSAALRRLIASHLDGQSRLIPAGVPVYQAEVVFDRPRPRPRPMPCPHPTAVMEKSRAAAVPSWWTQAFEQPSSKTLARTGPTPISHMEAPPWVAYAYREEYLQDQAKMRAAILAEERQRRSGEVTQVIVNGMIAEGHPDIQWYSASANTQRGAIPATPIYAEAATVESPPLLGALAAWAREHPLLTLVIVAGAAYLLWRVLRPKPEVAEQVAEAVKDVLPNFAPWTPVFIAR